MAKLIIAHLVTLDFISLKIRVKNVIQIASTVKNQVKIASHVMKDNFYTKVNALTRVLLSVTVMEQLTVKNASNAILIIVYLMMMLVSA